jgi:hypothetical protein
LTIKEIKEELTKITNKNEFIKKISSVLGSNDHIARSLTLRMLGYMSNIVSDLPELHYK